MPTTKKHKICRRLGSSVYDQCINAGVTNEQQRQPRGRRPKALSEYGQQMLEKQRARFTYGVRERQFANYVRSAVRSTGETSPAARLYQLLETRLDNVVYRLGFAPTRQAARQVVSHGHVLVNGRKMNIPSHHVKAGDEIRVKDASKDSTFFQARQESLPDYTPPAWLTLDAKQLAGTVDTLPTLDTYADAGFNLTSVLEFYSR